MSYGRYPYGGVGYAGADVAEIPSADTRTALSIEVAFTTGALETPLWVDVTADVRFWDVSRGRSRELERFQPGRATVVLGNRSGDYDNENSSSTLAGNVKPMRRLRIRETFNGVTYPVFDGFVDRWDLDYPAMGKDATATVTATDMFKILARTELGRSVYYNEVLSDDPVLYYPMDEARNGPETDTVTALNHGSLSADLEYLGPPLRFADQPLVTHDPGGSIFQNQDTLGESVFLQMGLEVPAATFDLFDDGAFALEAWVLPVEDPPGTVLDDAAVFSDGDAAQMNLIYDVSADAFVFAVANDAAGAFTATSATAPRNRRYHVVAKFAGSGSPISLWVNGVLTQSSATTGTFTSSDDLQIGNVTSPGNNNWVGNMSHAAVYSGAAATAVDQDWVDRHFDAGLHPWSGDLPGERLERVLDEVGVPDDLREIDTGATSFQSAELNVPALEHAQKASESEYGSLLFVNRAGVVRFDSRNAVFGRAPHTAVYGASAGNVGYRSIRFDDGDEVIRNRATISRYNGVAQTTTDTDSVTEFGRFQYVLDGLLHDSDAESKSYADFVVNEYDTLRRRITELTVGPVPDGDEALYYPAMLGPELGDAINVTFARPVGGTLFEQTCVVEGIRHTSAPGRNRTVTFTLSPEYSFRALEDEDVATLGYAEVTANQENISSETDLTGLSVDVTVGSNRYIKITYQLLLKHDNADTIAYVRIKEGTTVLQLGPSMVSATTGEVTAHGHVVLESPSAGAHTYKLSLSKASGNVDSLAAATFPASILVEDIGPA